MVLSRLCTRPIFPVGILVYCRLQAEVEEVLEGRTQVSNEDLEKLQYTEQVHSVGYVFARFNESTAGADASVEALKATI